MRGDLGWLKRIMFLLPIMLGITIANIAVVKHTRTRYSVPVVIEKEGRTRALIPIQSEEEQIEQELQKGWELLEKSLKEEREKAVD